METVNTALSQSLYQVSSALLLPVLVAVVLLSVVVLVLLGGFFREWAERPQVRRGLRQALGLTHQPPAAWKALADIGVGLPRRLTQVLAWPPASRAAPAKALTDLETEIADRLSRLGFFSRVGPMLGLLGTLIPFGPALAGLATDNVQQLSANLVTAFATTVVGLLCGCLTFAIALARRSWYARDFDDLEHLVQLLSEGPTHGSAATAEMGRDGRRSDGGTNQLV